MRQGNEAAKMHVARFLHKRVPRIIGRLAEWLTGWMAIGIKSQALGNWPLLLVELDPNCLHFLCGCWLLLLLLLDRKERALLVQNNDDLTLRFFFFYHLFAANISTSFFWPHFFFFGFGVPFAGLTFSDGGGGDLIIVEESLLHTSG